MKRRDFIKRLSGLLIGGIAACNDTINDPNTHVGNKFMKNNPIIEDLVRRKVAEKLDSMNPNAILRNPFCPPRLSVDELGWEEFLKWWDKEEFEFLKTEILNFGMWLAGAPDSHVQRDELERDKYEEWIISTEAALNVSLPRELFYGGIAYPAKTLLEEQVVEEKLALIQEALKKLLAYKNTLYGDPRQLILINGTHLSPPASEQALQKAEADFNVRLPPSYRHFLQVSNGCYLGLFTLMPVEKIGRTRDLHEHFNDGSIIDYIEENEDVPDAVYFQYDKLGITKEPFPFYRVKKFLNGLLISDPANISALTDIYPYYPESPFDDGEWEAFMMDGTRARSFKHLMEYLYLDAIIRWREKAGYWRP